MRHLVLIAILFFSCSHLLAQQDSAKGLPAGATRAMRSIDPEKLRAHVKFLASDLLEGRGTGQRGGELAAAYISTQFELYGLKPAGANGTYFQAVPLVLITTQPQTTFSIVPPSGAPLDLKLAEDYVVMDQSGSPFSEVDAEIVFAGFGISAPEYQWDDYKGIDVRGKVLLMLVNEPTADSRLFRGPTLTYYGRWTYKYEEAARRGAAGVLLVHKTDMASYGWDVVRNSNTVEKAQLAEETGAKLKSAGWVQYDVARRIAAAAGKDLETLMKSAQSRDFRPVSLPLRLRAHIVSKVRRSRSDNVLAILPGSDPRRKAETVLYSAHYDHFGIQPEKAGDKIYNGAADNATGCAVLLELARAFAEAPRPARSILFAAVTAEEQGLLGSEYLGKHPPVPVGKIALDLNFDNLPPIGDAEEAGTYGAERTSFYPVVQQTAREFQLQLRPDPNPGAGHYYRSDHFSLARVGVPGFTVNEGRKFKGHPREWGDQQAAEYNSQRYHQTSDEYRPSMDFSGNARMARFGFVLGWRAASGGQLVEWKPGDEFEVARRQARNGSSR